MPDIASVLGHLTLRADTLENILILGNIEGRRSTGMTEDEICWMQTQGAEFEKARKW